MSIYLLSTILFVIVSAVSSFFIYNRYKHTSGGFYLLFSVTISLWFLLYLISFDSSHGENLVLHIYRFQFSLSMMGLYSILFFVLFFGKERAETRNIRFQIYAWFITFFVLANFTPLILEGVTYSQKISSYAEIYGIMHPFVVLLYALLIPIFLIISFFKLKTLGTLNKIRLTYIVFGYTTFLVLILSFLVFIPFFSEDSSNLYFEQFTPIYTLPFIFAVMYSSYRYRFFDIYFSLGKSLVFLSSVILSTSIIAVIKLYFFTIHNSITHFWGISWGFSILDLIVILILFLFFYRKFSPYILNHTSISKFSDTLDFLKEKVPFLSTIHSLNSFLDSSFNHQLRIRNFHIYLLPQEQKTPLELVKFFKGSIERDVFINDLVFIEENKNKFNKQKILKELNPKISLVYPLFNGRGEVLGFVECGHQPYNDYYSLEQMNLLKGFVSFLQGHLKYISIYSQIHDLNLNLDKKVDEKTIEYNNLVNKQKEFIAFVSHEISNPVTNALFLCDAIIDDVRNIGQEKMKEDVSILNGELLKIGDLTKKIFSVERYDLNKIKLFKEHTDVYQFLNEEIEIFQNKHQDIDFDINLTQVGNCELDRVQLRQVVHNLITNAIKFSDNHKPKISIFLGMTSEEKVMFSIEDNGRGFQDIDIGNLFDRYSTGESSSIGLGLGLYLCKRIVELHGWNIVASHGKKWGGACFTVMA